MRFLSLFSVLCVSFAIKATWAGELTQIMNCYSDVSKVSLGEPPPLGKGMLVDGQYDMNGERLVMVPSKGSFYLYSDGAAFLCPLAPGTEYAVYKISKPEGFVSYRKSSPDALDPSLDFHRNIETPKGELKNCKASLDKSAKRVLAADLEERLKALPSLYRRHLSRAEGSNRVSDSRLRKALASCAETSPVEKLAIRVQKEVLAIEEELKVAPPAPASDSSGVSR